MQKKTTVIIFEKKKTARAALLTGRLPIRNGFYTSSYHGHNGCFLCCFYSILKQK